MTYNHYGKKETTTTSGLVYQHMSSHYRRILNAKAAIDTSTPESFRTRIARPTPSRRKNLGAPLVDNSSILVSNSAIGCHTDIALIDRIVADDTCNPTEICRRQWSTRHKRSKKNGEHEKNERFFTDEYGTFIKKNRQSGDLLERHEGQFKTIRLNFWPKILKTDVTSKLRGMRVYHPPRRKLQKDDNWRTSSGSSEQEEEQPCGCALECTCAPESTLHEGKEVSQASSRDSAYNGGNSSTPDSRSPTPYRRHRLHVATQTETNSSKPSIALTHGTKISDKCGDLAYIKFVHDITVEAVDNGQFTDKSLSKIINKHIAANVGRLNKGKMISEISKLKSQLGIVPDTGSNGIDDEDNTIISTVPTISNSEKQDAMIDSWTTHFLHLHSSRHASIGANSEPTQSIASTCLRLNALALGGESNDEDEEKDSDSSRETTIKEVLPQKNSLVGDVSGSNYEIVEFVEGDIYSSDAESVSG